MFIGLLVILFIGHLYVREGFHDSSGSMVNVSLHDLMLALGQTQWQQQQLPLQQQRQQQARPLQLSQDPAYAYLGMKDEILYNIRTSIDNQLAGSPLGAAFGPGGASTAQGNLYVESIPGKSPADDYIRKDSIPCYACSLP